MISLLFMASVMFPIFLPEGLTLPKIMRAQIAIIMFMSAYMAEVVRGGLSAVSQGQYEAASALGLGYWMSMRKVILPQALKIVIPPSVNTIIGMFKDTSLVVIIALSDLLMTTKTSLKDSNWLTNRSPIPIIADESCKTINDLDRIKSLGREQNQVGILVCTVYEYSVVALKWYCQKV